MQLMQSPTCTNVRIRHTHDAHKIFYGVQRGLLHMVTRRLDADERLALGSGCVYAWEERGPHTEVTGIKIISFPLSSLILFSRYWYRTLHRRQALESIAGPRRQSSLKPSFCFRRLMHAPWQEFLFYYEKYCPPQDPNHGRLVQLCLKL
jgi:hypothetical protein